MTSPNYQHPLYRAIDSFLADMRRNEDKRSRFYKEVLTQYGAALVSQTDDGSIEQCVEEMKSFVQDVVTQWKSTSKTMRTTGRLKPFMDGLWQYTQAFDVVVQVAPAPVVVLYGGARLLLQLAQQVHSCFNRVLDIMDDIGHLLACYQLFSTMRNSPDKMQNLLVESYKNIISFWQNATRLFCRKTPKTILTGFVKPLDAKWDKFREVLQKDKSRVIEMAQATEYVHRLQSDLGYKVNKKEQERKRIVDWIKGGEDDGKLDVRPGFRDRKNMHQPGTCQWLFQDPAFMTWKDAPENHIIWYHGEPGVGKSILCAALLAHLAELGRSCGQDFKTLLRYLSPEIPQAVVDLYRDDMDSHVSKLWDLHTAVKVTKALIKQLDRVYIVLDSLDECEWKDYQQLQETVGALMSSNTYGLVKWFFSSRNDSNMRLLSQHVGAEEKTAPLGLITNDIKSYLQLQVAEGVLPVGCVDHWANAAKGNFLWIQQMIRVLHGLDFTCLQEIKKELRKFPKGLVGCYLRSLQQLLKRSESHQDLTRRVFTLLVAAQQPLRLKTLEHAMSIQIGADDHSFDRIPRRGLIRDLCGPLVTFDYKSSGVDDDPHVKLAHKSIHDFFMQDPKILNIAVELHKFFIDERTSNLEVGRLCLTYLNYKRYDAPQDVSALIDDDRMGHHAFLRYAATCWFRHFCMAERTDYIVSDVERLFRRQNFWTCLAAQSKALPHVFNVYTWKPKASVEGIDKTSEDDREHQPDEQYSNPLPSWLDSCGPVGEKMCHDYWKFVKEWHMVFKTFPNAVDRCTPKISCYNGMISESLSKENPPDVVQLNDPLDPELHWRIVPGHLISCGSDIQCLLYRTHSFDGRDSIFLCPRNISLSAANLSLNTSKIASRMGFSLEYEDTLRSYALESAFQVTLEDHAGKSSLWHLDLNNLDLKCCTQTELKYAASSSLADPKKLETAHSIWKIQKRSHSLCSGGSVAFHCFRQKYETERMDSTTSLAGSDSDSDSDSSISSETKDQNNDENRARHNNKLVIGSQFGSFIPLTWQDPLGKMSQISCAFHPTESFVVWSHAAHEICKLDLRTRSMTREILPEPSGVSFQSVTLVYKDLKFSACGNILHYLLCLVKASGAEYVCSVVLVSWSFPPGLSSLNEMGRICQSETIAYRFPSDSKAPSTPSVLTSWTAQELYLALPTLSCCPKILRFSLPQDLNVCNMDPIPIQTLCSPIFFPASTPNRKPQFTVRKYVTQKPNATPQTLEKLVLVLDSSLEDGPVIMIWDTSDVGGWRDWRNEEQEKSEELKVDHRTWQLSRAQFTDPKRKFIMPARSGLDWKKKTYVSCGCW